MLLDPNRPHLRIHSQRVPSELNGFWENESFHNHAAVGRRFAIRATQTSKGGGGRSGCGVMSKEPAWWQCNRRIIADYLITTRETVIHILANGRTGPAGSTDAAVSGSKSALVYPHAKGPMLFGIALWRGV